jgi:hypothetical protein
MLESRPSILSWSTSHTSKGIVSRLFYFSYTPSQADVAVFEAVEKAPAAKYVNALRWYNHIASYKISETKQ